MSRELSNTSFGNGSFQSIRGNGSFCSEVSGAASSPIADFDRLLSELQINSKEAEVRNTIKNEEATTWAQIQRMINNTIGAQMGAKNIIGTQMGAKIPTPVLLPVKPEISIIIDNNGIEDEVTLNHFRGILENKIRDLEQASITAKKQLYYKAQEAILASIGRFDMEGESISPDARPASRMSGIATPHRTTSFRLDNTTPSVGVVLCGQPLQPSSFRTW